MGNKQTLVLVLISILAAGAAAFGITLLVSRKPDAPKPPVVETPEVRRPKPPVLPPPRGALSDPDAANRRRLLQQMQVAPDVANADDLFALLANEKDPGLRVLAFAALGQIKDPSVATRLLQLWNADTDDRTRLLALEEAARIGGPEVEAALQAALRAKEKHGFDAQVMGIAANGLVLNGSEAARKSMNDFLAEGTGEPDLDPQSMARSSVMEALAEGGRPEDLAALVAVVNNERLDPDVRVEAVEAIGLIETSDAAKALATILLKAVKGPPPGPDGPTVADAAIDMLSDREDSRSRELVTGIASGQIPSWEDARRTALDALGRMGGEGAGEILLQAARDATLEEITRGTAWTAYARVAGAGAAPELLTIAMGGGDGRLVRQFAVRGIALLPTEARLDALRQLADGAADPQVKAAAKKALEQKDPKQK